MRYTRPVRSIALTKCALQNEIIVIFGYFCYFPIADIGDSSDYGKINK